MPVSYSQKGHPWFASEGLPRLGGQATSDESGRNLFCLPHRQGKRAAFLSCETLIRFFFSTPWLSSTHWSQAFINGKLTLQVKLEKDKVRDELLKLQDEAS